ncbi:hypothetical protein Pmar_PMAR015035 [Perkinsus marinus ATCC 50983]|uniref:Uncharacterized protein n=1 Tax=Perkinsus marinus (strain ATCC 50983 / TXsc) TaxID=423536 RepID=C5KRK7_PERM5|nr:hypothetical protein Pmar_PMAR015035 [Perkinsus marinus ATCC 50983]EER12869.1 hypothetical protein Pmar_PMAR015035 [Perkinsus marinus ATCC 50983]|eukprot:XP_002781074.1 hypothetical protein Pmar_PMAR015035 [Perkinsus marinus ATCC 50983]
MSDREGELEVQRQNQHLKVDYSKPYAKRRPDEPRSHYAQRLKFINELIRGMGDSLSDERIDVLSNCYTNVKFLNNKYHPEIMEILAKYDPDVESVVLGVMKGVVWKFTV